MQKVRSTRSTLLLTRRAGIGVIPPPKLMRCRSLSPSRSCSSWCHRGFETVEQLYEAAVFILGYRCGCLGQGPETETLALDPSRSTSQC